MCFSDVFYSLWYTNYFCKSKEFILVLNELSNKTGFNICFHNSYVDFIYNGNVIYSFIFEIGEKYKLDSPTKVFEFLYPRLFEIKKEKGEITDEEMEKILTKVSKNMEV